VRVTKLMKMLDSFSMGSNVVHKWQLYLLQGAPTVSYELSHRQTLPLRSHLPNNPSLLSSSPPINTGTPVAHEIQSLPTVPPPLSLLRTGRSRRAQLHMWLAARELRLGGADFSLRQPLRFNIVGILREVSIFLWIP
jgi:hypothetical protein